MLIKNKDIVAWISRIVCYTYVQIWLFYFKIWLFSTMFTEGHIAISFKLVSSVQRCYGWHGKGPAYEDT